MTAIPAGDARQVRAALRDIVAEYGVAALSNPTRMANLLKDLLPDEPGVARMLIAAAEEHVADQLRDHANGGLDGATAIRLVVTSFAGRTLYTREACTWLVGEVALALGVAGEVGYTPTVVSPPPEPAGPALVADGSPAHEAPGSGLPKLAEPVTNLDFGQLAQHSPAPERRVQIGRLGGRPLGMLVASPTTWIRVRQAGDDLVVSVDTSVPGRYEGTVTVESDSGPVSIGVQALVAPVSPAPGTASAPRPCVVQAGQRVSALSFSADGARLASGGQGSVRIWDVLTAGELGDIPIGSLYPVTAVSFSPDGSHLAAACDDRYVRMWDVATGQLVQEIAYDAASPRYPGVLAPAAAPAIRGKVSALAFSPDGAWLAIGSRGPVHIWSLQVTEVVRDLSFGRSPPVTGLAFSSDGTRLAGCSGQYARIWDAKIGHQHVEVRHPDSMVLAVAFSPDGTRLAAACDDGHARIWDAATGKLRHEIGYDVAARQYPGVMAPHGTASIRGRPSVAALSADWARLATGGSDNAAWIWPAHGWPA